MNADIYLFGSFSSHYVQFPDDATRTLLTEIESGTETPTVLAIHRQDRLMHYAYVRRLPNGGSFGMALIMSHTRITHIAALFTLFEEVVAELAVRGTIIRLAADGSLTAATDRTFFSPAEVATVRRLVEERLSSLDPHAAALPAYNYGRAAESKSLLAADTPDEKVLEETERVSLVLLSKDKGFTPEHLDQVQKLLQQSKNEADQWQKKYEAEKGTSEGLRSELRRTQRMKRQFRWVIALLLLFLVAGAVGVALYLNLSDVRSSLSSTQLELATKKGEVIRKKKEIEQLNSTNEDLQSRLTTATEERDLAQTKLRERDEELAGYQPFIVTSTSFNFDTGYLTVKYVGLRTEIENFSLRTIFPDGSQRTIALQRSISTGTGEMTIYVNNSLNFSKYYSFELLYNGRIIGGGRH